MKKFETPELEIIKVEVQDVITTSGFNQGQNQFPIG